MFALYLKQECVTEKLHTVPYTSHTSTKEDSSYAGECLVE